MPLDQLFWKKKQKVAVLTTFLSVVSRLCLCAISLFSFHTNNITNVPVSVFSSSFFFTFLIIKLKQKKCRRHTEVTGCRSCLNPVYKSRQCWLLMTVRDLRPAGKGFLFHSSARKKRINDLLVQLLCEIFCAFFVQT